MLKALKARPGYQATRYRADSATVFIQDERVLLQGQALTERQGAMLEADTIRYRSDSCMLDASGSPHLFDRGQVLVGEGIRYDTCRRRGIVNDALTNFTEGSTVWFLRGNVAQDSSSSRIYAGSSEITSCDLPTPHYTFHARSVKWVSKNVLVARPVVLYVRDVPVLWLPFIFQDVRPGRRSGILIPQFGFNDLVRPTRTYNRQLTNVGYYWAPNDYMDLTGRLDWFANRYVQYGVSGEYRWLNRFMSGTVGVNQQRQVGGGSGTTLRWDHRQQFSLSSTLNFNINYASNSAVIRGNAIDPLQNTQQITSSLNYSKRLSWATLTLGGNRRQSLTDGSVTQLLPAVTLSPVPIAIGSNITWSPGLSFTNNTSKNPLADTVLRSLPGGVFDTLPLDVTSRITALSFDTPLRVGGFNWQNSVQVEDRQDKGAEVETFLTDDPATSDPTDSIRVRRTFLSDFQSSIDWDTGINLPVLFRGSWKIQPVVGVGNTTPGPFAIRNRNTNGDFVYQGKRFRFGATASPTLFAFFPGIGPLSRIRHSFSPNITWNYQPAADVPEAFARATAVAGQPIQLRSDAQQRVSVGLSQVFEGKLRPRGTDTSSTDARKIRILSINTSSITYDFEQAKKPGFTGWATQSLTNSVLSDLLPGFNLSFTHDLWRGTVGVDTADFDPFLQSVSASFALSGNTFRALGSIIGLGGPVPSDDKSRRPDQVPTSYVGESGRRTRPGLVLQQHAGAVPEHGPDLLRELQLPALAVPTGRHVAGQQRSAEPGVQHQFLAHAVLVALLVVAVQHHGWKVRVAGRAARARAPRMAGGLQLRAESQREFCVLFLDLPDRPARAQVRLRSDDDRQVAGSEGTVSSKSGTPASCHPEQPVTHQRVSERAPWHAPCSDRDQPIRRLVCARGGSRPSWLWQPAARTTIRWAPACRRRCRPAFPAPRWTARSP